MRSLWALAIMPTPALTSKPLQAAALSATSIAAAENRYEAAAGCPANRPSRSSLKLCSPSVTGSDNPRLAHIHRSPAERLTILAPTEWLLPMVA